LHSPTHTTAALDQAVTIEHRVDGAFGGDGDAGESTNQALADFARTPTGVLPLHVQNVVLYLKRKLIGVAVGTTTAVGQPLNATVRRAAQASAKNLLGAMSASFLFE
jgi:hypothetical protein